MRLMKIYFFGITKFGILSINYIYVFKRIEHFISLFLYLNCHLFPFLMHLKFKILFGN